MENVAPKWKKVAIAIGFDEARIEAIETGAFYQPENACLKMFTGWLNRGHDLKPPTWDVLIQSLRVANVIQMADMLHNTIEIVSSFSPNSLY